MEDLMQAQAPELGYIIESLAESVEDAELLQIRGRVTQVTGTIIKAVVPKAKVGELCLLRNPAEDFPHFGLVVHEPQQ